MDYLYILLLRLSTYNSKGLRVTSLKRELNVSAVKQVGHAADFLLEENCVSYIFMSYYRVS